MCMKGYKMWVYSDRGRKAIDYAKWHLSIGAISMIPVAKVKKSKVYKEVDKFLVESGCERVLVGESRTELCAGCYSITPEHYEYIR